MWVFQMSAEREAVGRRSCHCLLGVRCGSDPRPAASLRPPTPPLCRIPTDGLQEHRALLSGSQSLATARNKNQPGIRPVSLFHTLILLLHRALSLSVQGGLVGSLPQLLPGPLHLRGEEPKPVEPPGAGRISPSWPQSLEADFPPLTWLALPPSQRQSCFQELGLESCKIAPLQFGGRAQPDSWSQECGCGTKAVVVRGSRHICEGKRPGLGLPLMSPGLSSTSSPS